MKLDNKFSKYVKARYNKSRGDYALNIPKKMSSIIPDTEMFKCEIEGNRIIYTPVNN